METQKFYFFFQKNSKFEFWLVAKRWNYLSFVNISPTLVGNWYINGKVLTSTTPWKPKNSIFFQKSSKFEFWLVAKSWNHLSFVNISSTLVIDTSMERSSRVLQHGNPKIWIFFQKSSEFEFWLWRRTEITLTFVNISPTLEIDTSMEMSSRVLQHEKKKNWNFVFKNSKLTKFNFVRTPRK